MNETIKKAPLVFEDPLIYHMDRLDKAILNLKLMMTLHFSTWQDQSHNIFALKNGYVG